jgi:hypothetical protein
MDNNTMRFSSKEPCNLHRLVWLFAFVFIQVAFLSSCKKEYSIKSASLLLKTGVSYTADGDTIKAGGRIRIGILASGAGVPLTYLKIMRITAYDTITEYDLGLYVGREGYDNDFIFSRGTTAYEIWRVLVMNADRDTAVKSITVFRGEGTDYGSISFYPSITLGFQNNSTFNHFLDADNGITYNETTVSGHESEIDQLCYYYVTSNLPSPSFSCPGYTAAVGYYPLLFNWATKNSTSYDFNSVDNNLVSLAQFDAATNDSLLVAAFNSQKVSGLCKYCYTGKIIPFKTQAGKNGLIKIIHADETDTGSIEISIKVQK